MEKQYKTWMANLLCIILVLGSFTLAALLLVDVGIGAYKNIVLANNDNFQLRTSLSYIATKVRQTDTIDSTYFEKKDGADILVLGEEIDGKGYETRIYHKGGFLYELFSEKDMEYDLSYGTPVIEIADFEMKETADGFLKLKAINKAGDTQTLLLYLRTGGTSNAAK